MTLCETLTVIFILLKLFDLIDWSWLWVLSPVWLPITALFLLSAIAGPSDDD